MGTEGSGGDDIFKAFSPYFKHPLGHSNAVHAHMLSRQRETEVLVQTGHLTSRVRPHRSWSRFSAAASPAEPWLGGGTRVVNPFLVFAIAASGAW